MILEHINDIVSVCHGHGITTAVISPGSRSAAITLAFNAHSEIDVKVISDERSAAFIALGIAQQQKKPVALVCTSGSAVLNYAPAISEAFYQEVPLLVLSADRPPEWIDQYDGQTIQQSAVFGKHVKASFDCPVDVSHSDALWHSNRITNEALVASMSEPKGPVHINIPLREPFYPEGDEKIVFPSTRIIKHTPSKTSLEKSLLEELETEWSQNKTKAIVIGQTERDDQLTAALTEFAKRTNTVIINDVIGNNHSFAGVVRHQDAFLSPKAQSTLAELSPDLLITIGKSLISKNLKIFLRNNPPKAHWHVKNSDRINDSLQHLTRWVDSNPKDFFQSFVPKKSNEGFLRNWENIEKKAKKTTLGFLDTCDFGEFKAVSECINALPDNSQLHLANSMSVRYANLINLRSGIEVFSNRGTSGIDGSNGTAVGAAIAQDKTVTLVTGDMAFFYDRNAFWHSYDLSRLRVILLNNGGGGIFRMIKGPREQESYEALFHTDQSLTAENTAKDHDFEYFACSDLSGLNDSLTGFFESSDRPKLIEIFSDSKKNTEIFQDFKQLFES